MRTESRPAGSLIVTSAGERFGDPGFYFTVYGHSGQVWAPYVKAMRESIYVYPAEKELVRADMSSPTSFSPFSACTTA